MDTPNPSPDYFASTVEEVLNQLQTPKTSGLTASEAQSRLENFGPNRLRKIEQKSLGEIIVNQFRSLIVALLIAASVVSLIFGHLVEALAVIVVILINATIGSITELKAVQSMESLRQLGQVTSRVLRDGQILKIPAEKLVPGDIVLLEGGDIITADLRLLETSKLQIDESALTGESFPVDKDEQKLTQGTPLAERENMAYKGTSVTRGSGKGIVVATGMETELGEISSLVEKAEDQSTPLEEKLAELGHRLIWVTLVITATLAGTGIVAGRDLFLMIETSIALAVAAIPEGLPIVATLALARGMWRMAKRNALINRLSAVETLGGTDVIMTDKTGTLTENKMTVSRLTFESFEQDMANINGGPKNSTKRPEDKENTSAEPLVKRAGEVGVLCNNAELGEGEGRGDPIEVSLLEAGRKLGIERKSLLNEFPEVKEVAFDSESKMMATYHQKNGGYRVAVKGAPEEILDISDFTNSDEGRKKITERTRKKLLDKNESMAGDGLRVLALAEKEANSPETDPYEGLTFLGLVGMVDPPRKEVKESIKLCRDAGIRVVMVTGDQPLTAKKIGQSIGLVEESTEVFHARDLKTTDSLSLEEREKYLNSSIFARVSPKQKLDLIALHQENNSVVAMTGDGVNDAPALKKADIGIAMGMRGTQVAQQAADMILKDDKFSTILAAVEGGRVIFGNIRRFVRYLLSCNVSEILAVTIASFAGLPLPLLPLQILFLNLVTDVFPALALGFDEGGPSVMDKPPRSNEEPIVRNKDWLEVGVYGMTLALAVLGSLVASLKWLGLDVAGTISISFLTLSFAQLWHVFNMSELDSKFFINHITKNPYVWSALALCISLVLIVVYVPILSSILSVYPPGPDGWALVLIFSLFPVLVGQLYKLAKKRF